MLVSEGNKCCRHIFLCKNTKNCLLVGQKFSANSAVPDFWKADERRLAMSPQDEEVLHQTRTRPLPYYCDLCEFLRCLLSKCFLRVNRISFRGRENRGRPLYRQTGTTTTTLHSADSTRTQLPLTSTQLPCRRKESYSCEHVEKSVRRPCRSVESEIDGWAGKLLAGHGMHGGVEGWKDVANLDGWVDRYSHQCMHA